MSLLKGLKIAIVGSKEIALAVVAADGGSNSDVITTTAGREQGQGDEEAVAVEAVDGFRCSNFS